MGTYLGAPVRGRAIAVVADRQQFLFALGHGRGNRWEQEGGEVFRALIDSVTFTAASPDSNGACAISSDSTCGYTLENPIAVGGGHSDGPFRELAYLDNLRGPKGERLTYVRIGSTTSGDVLLDKYRIEGLSKPTRLYINEYAYSEPRAPVGFTCVAPFPIEGP